MKFNSFPFYYMKYCSRRYDMRGQIIESTDKAETQGIEIYFSYLYQGCCVNCENATGVGFTQMPCSVYFSIPAVLDMKGL